MNAMPRFSVGVPSGAKYGSSIAAVRFSTMPSSGSFTLVAA